jgi:hypothetical protein
MKKWAKELNRAFSKEEVQMAKTHEKMFTIPVIKEMQIKTRLRCHLTAVRMATKNTNNNKCWQ